MKTLEPDRPIRPLISQLQNNTTLWIGALHPQDGTSIGGQTFCCPIDAIIHDIQVLATCVPKPGCLSLTLHEFDEATHTWGPIIGSSATTVAGTVNNNWICFDLNSITLRQNKHYAFRLYSDDGIIGLGEAVHASHQPFVFGEAWNGHGKADSGKYFRYFSLVFKVEMCA